MTLISIPLRLMAGGIFWARGEDALLVDEEGCPHSFKLIDGLHRHVPEGVTPEVLEWTKWLKEGPNPSSYPTQVLTAAPSRPRKYLMGFLVLLSKGYSFHVSL